VPVRIERVNPRPGANETPVETDRGFELVDRRIAGKKNKVENSTFVRSIEEAAYLVEQGFAIVGGARNEGVAYFAPKSSYNSHLSQHLPIGAGSEP